MKLVTPILRASRYAAACVLLTVGAAAGALPLAEDTVFYDGFEAVVEVEDPCSHPLIAPAGWDTHSSTWTDAWSSPDGTPQAAYPNSVGFPVPLGANKGKIKVINFVPRANQTVDISWDGVQANLEHGYYPRPALSMFISISLCPGDVRPPDNASPDPFLHPGCRTIAGGGSMFFTTQPGYTNPDTVCTLEAGRMYFMNVAPIDPSNGLSPGEHTCDDSSNYSEQGCEVQAVHHGY